MRSTVVVMICSLSHKQSHPETLTPFGVIPWLVVMLMLTGCAQTPKIYTMRPPALESIRSEMSTIGVYLLPEYPETEVLLPAKGFWGGAKRGFVVGATLPVMIGFVSPIPGGTLLGLIVSPFGALVGCVYGMSTAIPDEEIEHAEVMLEIAAENLRQMGLSESFINSVVDLGNASTDLKFVAWPGGQAANDLQGRAQPVNPSMDSIDARLQMRIEKSGLRGRYSIDPPTETFLQIHVQLIRLRDQAILIDEHVTCASEEERTFKDWTDQFGTDLITEFEACVPELAEKIVDDFFRVYPVRWSYGELI